jgi:gliding motility-associated-like protein
MKNKLLLFLIICNYFSNNLNAINNKVKLNFSKENFEFVDAVNYNDSIKKQNKILKTAKTTAVIPPPLVTAGSACKEVTEATVQVFITASGRSGDIIEWYASQNSTTILHKGAIYGPVISKTTTFYVQTRSGLDNSVRVPVVASVYTSPPSVTLTSSPENSVDSPLCFGTPTTFTAVGGADLFEFSIDGVVVQAMSTNRTFTTSALTNGQIVSVRTRYGVNFDGIITETAWGTGAMEDNLLSASLSPSAVDGYINSIKISPTENELVFGIAGELNNNRSLLLFLDTKPGGFNVSNYGDEPLSGVPLVKAFNLFNNNPSTFDRDFFADYCLAISTDDGGTNYFADIIELKSGVSTKVHLGNASLGNPTSNMGVDTGNSGTTDHNLGFEVAVLKSIIGYTEGELSFFALTMQDDSAMNYNVTNSFLSPELSSTADYGSGAINYNDEDPNPVVVSANAFMPCYKTASKTAVIVQQPTIASVGTNQKVCTLVSNPLGGNTPVVGTGVWTKKSGPGSVVFSNSISGSSTATVSVEGTYVFTWTISNSICTPSTADITVEFHNPLVIPTATVIQPSCAIPSGTISMAAQSGVTYSLDGINFFSSNTFTGLTPNSYTLYVRSTSNTSCVTPSASVIVINSVPTPPAVPTTANVVQPTCSIPSGTISIATQTGVEYSLNGTTYQTSNVFTGLAPNNYTLYVRKTSDNSCLTSSTSTTTINAIPTPPAVPTVASVVQPTCTTPSGTIAITIQSGVQYSLNGTTYQLSNIFTGLAPGNYTLYVRKISDNTCISVSPTATVINPIPVIPVPTTSSVIQPTCGIPSGTITITTQSGVQYSLNGTNFQTSNTFAGLNPGSYTLYVRSTADNTCITPSTVAITINAIPTLPAVPTMSSVLQPTCGTPSGTITITTQSGVEYSLNGINFQTSNTFAGLAPNSYILYVRRIADNTCQTQSSSPVVINPLPALPSIPTLASVIQPSCLQSTGQFVFVTQSNVQYSIGGAYQDSPVFSNVFPGTYRLSVRFTNSTSCITLGAEQTINPVPAAIQFESTGDCVDKDYILTASPLSNSYDPNTVDYQWEDNLGNSIGANSNILNVSEILASMQGDVVFPLNFSLTISSSATACITIENVVIESAICNIQKGISPDGNGSNDYFDLSLMDVKKLEIFDRYGIPVYSKSDYTIEWKGQSNNGNELPSATYYYVIEFNNGSKAKTGWIYLIREK